MNTLCVYVFMYAVCRLCIFFSESPVGFLAQQPSRVVDCRFGRVHVYSSAKPQCIYMSIYIYLLNMHLYTYRIRLWERLWASYIYIYMINSLEKKNKKKKRCTHTYNKIVFILYAVHIRGDFCHLILIYVYKNNIVYIHMLACPRALQRHSTKSGFIQTESIK